MDDTTFIATLGPLYEKSFWIAEAAREKRPFESREALLQAFAETVESAGEAAILALFRAHPDLAARMEEQSALTRESLHEQSAAGLLNLDEAQSTQLRNLNQVYRERFGFPFIICARLNDANTILQALELRVNRERPQEIAEAWSQVQKIAALRLEDLLAR